MNEGLLEESFFPQSLDSFPSLTASGFISYFSLRNGTVK